MVVVGLPVGAKGWDSEKWFDVGHALLKMRKEEDDVVILGIGSTRPKNVRLLFSLSLRTQDCSQR